MDDKIRQPYPVVAVVPLPVAPPGIGPDIKVTAPKFTLTIKGPNALVTLAIPSIKSTDPLPSPVVE